MDLEESNNMPNIKSKDKDTISLGFLTFEEKLICLNEYTLNKTLNEVIDDFNKKNIVLLNYSFTIKIVFFIIYSFKLSSKY